MKVLNIHNNREEMAQLEPFLEEVGEAFGIAPDVSFQINLALDEALANSVDYAYPVGTEGIITLEADLADGSLIFRLIDEGQFFDPTEEGGDVDTTLSAEERPIGGLGIFLIKQMMNDVSYERKDDKNILTMIKTL